MEGREGRLEEHLQVERHLSELSRVECMESYSLGEIIGRGGSAVVHKAWQRKTGGFVAIKKLEMKDGLEAIATEIELLSKLDHQNIVKYVEAVEDGAGHLCIVLEYMENGSLSSVVKHFGTCSEPVCGMYVRQVLSGLDYLHTQGVLHRDIKGANILTTKEGVAKLADFGLAARAAALGDAGVQDEVLGSPYWMAPEIIEMSRPSAACDIWSLGCTVIELTNGKPPYFDLAPMSALFRVVQDEMPLPGGISEALRDFLLQCFNKEPGLRAGARTLLSHAWLARASALGPHPTEHVLELPKPRDSLTWHRTPPTVSLRSLTSGALGGDDGDGVDLDAFLEEKPRRTDDDETNLLLLKLAADDGQDDDELLAPVKLPPKRLSTFREDEDQADEDGLEFDAGIKLIVPTPTRINSSLSATSVKTSEDDDESSDDDLSSDDDTALKVDDPFASGLFDDDKDFMHDDARERETRRLDEIETLLARLPLGGDDSRKTDARIGKTEAACAALRRLIDPQVGPETDDAQRLVLSERALSSLLETVDDAAERRCLPATVAVLRVVNSVCRRGDLDLLVALGLVPVLARLATDLLTSPPEKTASTSLAQLAAAVEHVCAKGSDDALRLFIGAGGLGLLVNLLLPVDLSNDDDDDDACVDAHRWTAAKLAIDALVCVLGRDTTSRAQQRTANAAAADAAAAGKSSPWSVPSPSSSSSQARPTRNAICLILARLEAPPRLAAGLAAAVHLEDAARRAAGTAGDDAAARRRLAAASALAERSASALIAFCEADAHVRDRVARPSTIKVVLAVLKDAPERIALMMREDGLHAEADRHARLAVALVKALKALCMASADALDRLAAAGAIEVVVGVLAAAQRRSVHDDDDCWDDLVDTPERPPRNSSSASTPPRRKLLEARDFPRRDELEDQLVPCLYYLCRIDRARLARAAAAGAARRLAACVVRRRHLKQFALAVLCDLCHAASADCAAADAVVTSTASAPSLGSPPSYHDDVRDHGDTTIAAELWRAGGVRLFARLLAENYWGVRALAALAAWLSRDATRRVEEELATRTCAERVVSLLRAADRAEFEHALPPLRDALERSPLFALALLRVGAEDDVPDGRRRERHVFATLVGRRLRRHTSAIVRKALLEILRAALKAASRPRTLLAEADLNPILEKLARDTSQVLVRDLALSITSVRYADDDYDVECRERKHDGAIERPVWPPPSSPLEDDSALLPRA